METIKNYLDNVFKALPRTKELLQVKRDLLVSMEEKYYDFKEDGLSENEAVGRVIAEFGDIDELIEELGVSMNDNKNKKPSMPELTEAQAEEYLEVKRGSGLKVAIGVFLIIMGVNAMTLFGAVSEIKILGFTFGSPEALGAIPLFLSVAVAVALFIFSGQETRKFDYLEQGFYIRDSVRAVFRIREEKFMRTHTLAITIGVVLCILSPLVIMIPNLLSESFQIVNVLNLPGISLNSSASGISIMLSMVAVAVFLFIYYGSIKTGYDLVLQQEDYSYVSNKETSRFVNVFESIIWPLAIIIFLLLGFLRNLWHIAWIVFPIAGLLSSMVTNLYSSLKE
jgi:hypothetical protein